MRRYLIAGTPLVVLYLTLTANLELSNVFAGMLIAGFITFLLKPSVPYIHARAVPMQLWAAMKYFVILLSDIIRTGLGVARIVVSRSLPIHPGILGIPLRRDNELVTALAIHALTVTPGQLVVAIDDAGVMYTHCLDVSNADQLIAQARALQTEHLCRIVGSTSPLSLQEGGENT